MQLTIKLKKETVSNVTAGKAGVYQPIEYYRDVQKYSAETLQRIQDHAPSEDHPLLGKTYAVDIKMFSDTKSDIVTNSATWTPTAQQSESSSSTRTTAGEPPPDRRLVRRKSEQSSGSKAKKRSRSPSVKKEKRIKDKGGKKNKKKENWAASAKKIVGQITPLVETLNFNITNRLNKKDMKGKIPDYMQKQAKVSEWNTTLTTGEAPQGNPNAEDIMDEIKGMQLINDNLNTMLNIASS